MTALAIELRRSKFVFAAVPLVALGAFIAHGALWDGLSIWANGTEAVVASNLVVGPLAAGLAAWNATRLRYGGMKGWWRGARDGGIRAAGTALLAELIWVAAIYVLIAAITLIPLSFSATWGQPIWVWLLSGFIAVAAQVAIGQVAGYVVPHFVVPGIVAVGLYALNGFVLVSNPGRTSGMLSFGFTQVQEVNFRTNLQLILTQAAWYAAILALAAAIAIAIATCKTAIPLVVAVAAIGVAAVAGSSIVDSRYGFFIHDKSDWQFACEANDDGVDICLHPAYESARPQLTEALEPVIEKTSGTVFGSDRYELTHRGYLAEPTDGAIAFHLDQMYPDWVTNLRVEVAQDLVTPGSQSGGPCETEEATGSGSAYEGPSTLIVAWISGVPETAYLPDVPAADQPQLGDWSKSDQATWLAGELNDICSGSLALDAFN